MVLIKTTNLLAAAQPPMFHLGDVVACVEASPKLGAVRKRDMISALRSTARLFGQAIERIPAEPRTLREGFAHVSPAAAGISLGRLDNIRSLVLAALKEAGKPVLPGRSLVPLGSAWASLWSCLPSESTQTGLSRFISYCNAHDLLPSQVSLETFAAFRDALEHQSLSKKPTEVYRTTCRLWNKAAQTIQGWPDLAVPVPLVARGYSMEWHEFPTSFVEDVERFLRITANPDVLADDYCRPVRPATVTTRRVQLRMIATALVRSGFPVEQLESLGTLVQVQNAKAAMRFFLERGNGQTSKFTHQHALLLQTIARHWVKVDHAHVMALRDLRRRLLVETTGMTEKNQTRLRQFDNAGNVDALVNLPQRVFRELARKDDGKLATAKRAMRALAVELLLHVPMRIGNLAGIETTRHLVPMRVRSVVTVHLVVPGEETKNGMPLEVQLPVETVELLATYLERYHPRLEPKGSTWLFPGNEGQRCSTIAFGQALGKFVRRETGLQMNPHLFRHLAAKLHLDAHPDDHGTTQRLLGHKNGDTTRKYYEGFRAVAAFRRFDGVIADLRARPQPPRRTPAKPAARRRSS